MDNQKELAGIFKDFGQVALAFGIAAFFGLIRVLQDYIAPDAPPKFRWLIAVAKTLVAGSAGMLTMWVCLYWEVGPYLSAFLIAIAGYGGAETLNACKEALYDFIRRKALASTDAPPKN